MSELGPYERMTDDEKRQYFRDIQQPKPQLITRVEAQALVAAALGRAAQYVHDKGCGWYGAGTPESDACLELLEPGIRALISSDAQAAFDALVREAKIGELNLLWSEHELRFNPVQLVEKRLAQLKAEGEKP